jgi:lipopolysaccharide cholinephosphotransferase
LDYIQKDSKNGSSFFDGSIKKYMEELRYLRLNKNRAWWKNLLVLLARLLCPKSLNRIARDQDSRAKAVSCSEKTPWIANLHGAWKAKEIVPSEYFGKGANYTFEGRQYRGVENYDGYLSSLYGDYMTPPPLEKRVTHHGFIAKWK